MRCSRHTPLKDRLLARRLIHTNGCWLWTGCTDRYGYGKMMYRGRIVKAHRASLHVYKGMPLDDPRYGLHHCDTPACFNPDHLDPGMPAENSRHTWDRGRHGVGRSPAGTFTPPPADNSDLPF